MSAAGKVERTKHAGVFARHQRGCPVDSKARPPIRCECVPTYQAKVTLPGRRQRTATHATIAAARSWQVDARKDAQQGKLRPRTIETLHDAWERILSGMRDGTVRTRSRKPYAPLTIQSYDAAMRLRVLPALGPARLGDVQREDIEQLVIRLEQQGLSPATIGNTITPLQIVYRQSWVRRLVVVDPTIGVETEPRRARAGRVLSAAAAAELVDGLADVRLRAFWVLLLFAGLRRSEALALRWDDVAFDSDPPGLEVRASKTSAGVRWVPLLDITRRVLRDRQAAGDGDLVVGLSETRLRRLSMNLDGRGKPRIDDEGQPVGPLVAIVPHDARKTFASLLGAAGVAPEAITRVLGHATYETTRDHYLREMPDERLVLAGLVKNAVGH